MIHNLLVVLLLLLLPALAFAQGAATVAGRVLDMADDAAVAMRRWSSRIRQPGPVFQALSPARRDGSWCRAQNFLETQIATLGVRFRF